MIRYGEELGMGDDLTLKERISVRTPMQWSGTKNAGFTTADSAFRPVISEGKYGFSKINAEQQWRDSASLLSRIAAMIKIRKSCPEIGLGDPTVLETGAADVLAMRYDYEGKSLIILHNFSGRPRKVTVPGASGTLYNLWDSTADIRPREDRLTVELPGYGYSWYRVGQVLP